MTLLDWLTTLAREPVSDFALGSLADWLEERGDKRGEIIRRIKITVDRYGIFNVSNSNSFSTLTWRSFLTEISVRKALGNDIVIYLLSTDPIS